MADPSDDDFYVGYLPEAPPALARVTKRRVALVMGIIALVAVLLVAGQHPFAKATFEFAKETQHEGWIQARPYPMLVVARPGAGAPSYSRYLLVDFGKFGAPEEIEALHGKRVRLKGTLVYRDDQTMLELAGGSIEEAQSDGPRPELDQWTEDLGRRTFVGEIVDSKCFLGVMKPGNLKTHRACATLCISGGIPPVLLVRDEDGAPTYLLLADAGGGRVNERVLDRIAEPLEITGELVRYGNVLVLRSDPATYRAADGDGR